MKGYRERKGAGDEEGEGEGKGRGRATADGDPKRDTICEFHASWTFDKPVLHRVMTWHIEDHTHMCKLDMECVELIYHLPPRDRLKDTQGLECAWFYRSCSDL